MQFTTALIALVASTATAAVLPRASEGQWEVVMTTSPTEPNIFVYAGFSSDEYPKLRNSCVEDFDPYFHRCDQTSFDFKYDGKTLELEQHLPNGKTVYASVEFVPTTDIGEGRKEDTIIVPVSRATV